MSEMSDDCLDCGQPADHWTHFDQNGLGPDCDYLAPAESRTPVDHHAKAAELRARLEDLTRDSLDPADLAVEKDYTLDDPKETSDE